MIPSRLRPIEGSESLVSNADHHPGNSVSPMYAAARQRAVRPPAFHRDITSGSPGTTTLNADAKPYIPLKLNPTRSSHPPPRSMHSAGSASARETSQNEVHDDLYNQLPDEEDLLAGAWETSQNAREAEVHDDLYNKLPAEEDLLEGLYPPPQDHLQNTDHRIDPASLLPHSVDEIFYANP